MSEEQQQQQQDGGQGGARKRRRRRRKKKGGGEGGGGEQQQQQRSQQRQRSNRSKRRRNRGGGGGGGGGGNNNSGGGNVYKGKAYDSKFGGREPRATDAEIAPSGPLELTPFELFCAYHLGITENNGYKRPSAREVARRFDVSVDEMHEAMSDFGIDSSSLGQRGFDLSLARLDVRVVPEGVDRREIARVHFNELIEENPELRELFGME